MTRKNSVENNLCRIGQLVEINRNEIITIMKAKKYAILATVVVFCIGALTALGGPIPLKYGSVSVQDFSWPWRMV
ncbi:MAG: hypothetical protein NTV74_04300 [Euryarchaeota archaeon]|nr:hypothetical protein [Euryarchaeota archaeon]